MSALLSNWTTIQEVAMFVDSSTIPNGAAGAPAIDDLSSAQRLVTGLRALARLRQDPDDTEMALRAALHLNAGRLPKLVAAFEAQPEGRELLRTRPAIDSEHVDLAALANLPEGTLGRSYSEFLRSRNLTPEVFAAPREVRNEQARYIAQRIRQTHDLWHVVTGYDTHVLGEVELQAFTYAQLKMPFSLLIALFGASKASPLSPRVASRIWAAYRRGKRAEPLVWRAWERLFATPLSELRLLLRLT
jgi:ubiquinone biosynthesis protein COQ4